MELTAQQSTTILPVRFQPLLKKTIPVAADLLLIEDSAAGYVKKRLQISNLPVASPAGQITVATVGADFTTITAGLAAASAGDAVLVYPGTYAESVTIPANVMLRGIVRITKALPGQAIVLGLKRTGTFAGSAWVGFTLARGKRWKA